MSLNWETVLGGSGRPRYLICDDELVSNRSFEANMYGWGSSPLSGSVSRELDTATFYGDYSLKIEDVGAQVSRSRARFTISLASVLQSRSFALSFHVRGAVASCLCGAQLKCLDYEPAIQTKALTTNCKHFFGIFEFGTSEETSMYLDIYAVVGSCYANTINVDNVSCREILYDLYDEFPYNPNNMQPDWSPEILSSGRLVDGSLREYERGWDPRFMIEYDYLDATAEYYRRLLSEAKFIWLQPHYDYSLYVAVKWDRAWSQRYFGNVYAGHIGRMVFKSLFLLESKPLDV